VVVVTLVLATLLGTVCAISLWLSAVLSRTSTSAVLAYLSVFGLAIGTVIVFGLVSASTAEEFTETYVNDCPPPPPGVTPEEYGCVDGEQTYTSSRLRTDRTWFLLAPNPFVVLADAAPQLPRERPRFEGDFGYVDGVSARDYDPLGQLGEQVRQLRRPPAEQGMPSIYGPDYVEPPRAAPVWPTGLAVNVLLGAGALVLTARRLRTPTRTLPKGQRVA
jgi:hypothetical protein